MRKLLPFAALTVAAAAFTGAAIAATSPATTTFQVKITITKACSVSAGATSLLDLGSVDTTATNTSNTSNISVTCSKNTPYFIGLLPSNTNNAGAGVMAGAASGNSDKVPYQLYSDAALSTVWGDTATSSAKNNGVAGTGNGAAQSIPVWAKVPSANYTPDVYTDTVTIHVNY